MVEQTGLELTGLARKAGLAPSTLTRFMNNPVNHVLSTTTLAKLAAVCPLCGQTTDYAFLQAIGRRMLQVREAIAPGVSDAKIASLIGWSEKEMAAIFAGEIEPTLTQFFAFAKRMRVTTDFLFTGALEGMSRRAELALTRKFPEYLSPDPGGPEDTGESTDTGLDVHKISWRR
jgi:transcriptional regulator with XRE-family HTH domain